MTAHAYTEDQLVEQPAIDELIRDRSAMSLPATNREVYALLKNGIRVSVAEPEETDEAHRSLYDTLALNPRKSIWRTTDAPMNTEIGESQEPLAEPRRPAWKPALQWRKRAVLCDSWRGGFHPDRLSGGFAGGSQEQTYVEAESACHFACTNWVKTRIPVSPFLSVCIRVHPWFNCPCQVDMRAALPKAMFLAITFEHVYESYPERDAGVYAAAG